MRSSLLILVLFAGFYLSAQNLEIAEIDEKLSKVEVLIFDLKLDSVELILPDLYEACVRLDYKAGIARSLALTGTKYSKHYKLDSALYFLEKAKELYVENDYFGDKIESRYSLVPKAIGGVYRSKREWELSNQYLEEAIALDREAGDSSGVYAIINMIATNKAIRGEYVAALDYWTHLYQIPDLEERIRSQVVNNIAVTYKNMGLIEKAIQMTLEGVRIDEQTGNTAGIIAKNNNLGNFYLNLNVVDSAIYYTQRSLETAKTIGASNSIVISISNLAELYILEEQFGLALSYMNEALEIADSVGITDMREKFHLLNAQIKLRRSEYDSAIHYAKRALESSSKYQNLRYSSDLTLILSHAYQSKNQADSSLKYLNQHLVLKDSLFNKDNQRTFTKLYSQIENLEKQKQIDQLKFENIEAGLRNKLTIWMFSSALVILTLIFLVYRNRQMLRESRLKRKLEVNQHKLSGHTLNMVYRNNSFTEIEEEIKKMKVRGEPNYQKILNIINSKKSIDKDWDNFNEYFSQVHPKFSERLFNKYPNLALGDRRLAALIKLNLTNREMASILFIELKSIRMAKYRLKRKLNLAEEDDLHAFLAKFE